jgi:hypothetical protein
LGNLNSAEPQQQKEEIERTRQENIHKLQVEIVELLVVDNKLAELVELYILELDGLEADSKLGEAEKEELE